MITAAAILGILISLFISSCAAEPDVPVVMAAVVTTTTVPVTSTLPPPVISQVQPAATTTVAPAPTTTTTILRPAALPSIAEPALRNLYGTARAARDELFEYGIDTLLPDRTASALRRFADVTSLYDIEICRLPYDGVSAYKISGELSAAGVQLEAVLKEGLPVRAAKSAEETGASRAHALDSGAEALAGERFAAADLESATAADLRAVGQYRPAITGLDLARALYESAAARAKALATRNTLEESGLASYAPYHRAEADRLLADEGSRFETGTPASLSEGVAMLGKAEAGYKVALEIGRLRFAGEKRAQALEARSAAEAVHAQKASPAEFSDASARLDQGTAEQDPALAAEYFASSAAAFERATGKAISARSEAVIAQAAATEALERQNRCLALLGIAEDEHLAAARGLLVASTSKLESSDYDPARIDAVEALRQIRLSESLLDASINSRLAGLEAELAATAAELAGAKGSLEFESARADRAEAELADLRAEYGRLLAARSSADADALAAAASRFASERAALETQSAASRAELERLALERAALDKARADLAAQRDAQNRALIAEAARLAEESAALAAERDALAKERARLEAEAARLAATTPAATTLARPAPSAKPADSISATELIAIAELELRSAESRNAGNNYPDRLASGKTLIARARKALEAGDLYAAAADAGTAKSQLAAIPEFAPLPAKYKVRLIVPNTDSLWNIATYSFVYGNPYLWTRLYAANRDLMYDRDDPHLILPNQVLTIPSLWGEYREGVWDPKKTYPDIKAVTGTSRK